MTPKWCPKYSKTELGGYLGVHFFDVLAGLGRVPIFSRSKGVSKAVGPHWTSLDLTANHCKPDHPGCIFLSKCLQMLLVLLYLLTFRSVALIT